MKTIYLSHPHDLNMKDCPQSVMALGFFDGVHRGHQKVILEAKKKAMELGLESSVMTFHPHPSAVLRKSIEHVKYITPPKVKEEVVENLGIDRMYVVKFDTSFAGIEPQQFVDEYIIGLNVKHVVAGFDFSYGRLGRGTMETLPFHARNQFTQTTIGKVAEGEVKVSSTLIRQCLNEGAVSAAGHYLGRPYMIKGQVVHGEKRGRSIGFPTANVEPIDAYILPPTGVYAVRMKVDDKWYNGVSNIGFKPTFHDGQKEHPDIEVHLFHFNDSIYGKEVTIEWHKRIRAERKFHSLDDLTAQIQRDKEETIHFFKGQ